MVGTPQRHAEPFRQSPLGSTPRRSRPRPTLTPEAHGHWRHLILSRCGLDFGETRREFLARRLWRRMGEVGSADYASYLDRLQNDLGEWHTLLEILVNTETSFFRHPPSFEALRKVLHERLRPGLSQEPRASNGPLRLWSAGCSTGQEAYSLAICALDSLAMTGSKAEVLVLAGDLSRVARDKTREGSYTERQMAGLSPPFIRRHFRRQENGHGSYRVSDALRAVVQVVPWNISRPETYPTERQAAIFCQNLLIYLPQDRREDAVRRLTACLEPGGHLFLAPGEILGLRLPGFERVDFPECLVFRRTH